MTAQWYEEWFNTEEYLNVYRHRNEAEARKHIEFILGKIRIQPGAKVLDMACGAGRHSIILSQKGYKVTAVDLSENLLCAAARAAGESGLEIEFVKSDLRDIVLDEKFDLVINLFTSFGYFECDEENYRIFDTALRHLNYNGHFVIDFLNKKYLENNIRVCSDEVMDGKQIIQRRSIVKERIIKKIEIRSAGMNKFFYESVRLFSPSELISELNDRGLFVDRVYGDFEGNPFDENNSKRIIIFAVR